MRLKTIRWQLLLSYAGIALLAALLLGAIMLTVLQRYYANQEREYLTGNAVTIAEIILRGQSDDLPIESLEQYLTSFAFFSNTQIRLLDSNKDLLVDTGPPANQKVVSFLTTQNNESGTSFVIFEDPFSEDVSDGFIDYNLPGNGTVIVQSGTELFPGWVMDAPQDVAHVKVVNDDDLPRSRQVVELPFYDQDAVFLGTIEMSNGPAYGREIIRSVAVGWAIAGGAAVLLAASAGILISRRFSTPLESLAQTALQMAAGDLTVRSKIERRDEFGVLADTFNQMVTSIETKVATLRLFVADAAHGLHTPLTALRLNLELVEDPQIPRAIEKVNQMEQLTSSLLNLSKLEALNVETQFEEFDLIALVNSLSEPYASRAEQAGLDFVFEIFGENLVIYGDVGQVRTLIGNLLENAIKFTPEGGMVQLELGRSLDAIYLRVIDTGIGIPADDVPNLFSRFFRGRNASTYSGSGLGLAISKTIADLHHAQILVENLDHGTMLEVNFPIRR